MCGFAGFFNTCFSGATSEYVIRRMCAQIDQRGPDDYGFWNDSKITLGHQRLAIQDLSNFGHQPMQSAMGDHIIVFNGEIYNYESLRLNFQYNNPLCQWRSFSDTEILLECVSTFGFQSTLPLLSGMFSFAVWDKKNYILSIARDRIGEKPLYWGWQGDTLLFGSELKALKAHPNFKGVIDRNSLALFLRHGYIPEPYTIYKGIYKLPAGHFVSIPYGAKPGDVKPQAYWIYNDAVTNGIAHQLTGSDQDCIDALEAQLSLSVSDQMLSDVPLGAFLSGGIDSSTVVALMQKHSEKPVRTFAIGFDEPGYNEAEYAKAVATHLGTNHTELYVSAADALSIVPKLPTIYCEPFADSSQIPTYLVSQLAKRDVTVALGGDGGDELFGGYTPYQFAPRIWNSISRVPYPLRRFVQRMSGNLVLPDKFAKLRDVLAAKSPEEFYRQLQSHWQTPDDIVIGSNEPTTLFNQPENWPKVNSFEEWMMAIDAQTYLPDDILVKVDRAAMANSLETRVPFLDHRVVELAWRLPMHMKIRNGQGKWALRQVLYRYVPQVLIERPKKGFSIPLAQWLRGPLRDWAEALLDVRRLNAEGYFRSEIIRKVWLEHLAGKRDHSTRLWSILMFQAWLEVQ